MVDQSATVEYLKFLLLIDLGRTEKEYRDIVKRRWVADDTEPPYNNVTCLFLTKSQNCPSLAMGHIFSRFRGSIKDEEIQGNLCKKLEELSKVKEKLHINAKQCHYMLSKMVKLLHTLQQDQSPAAQEFHGIVTRASILMEECNTERWLLKAVEIGDCPEHFVELHLDLHFSSDTLLKAGHDIEWDKTSMEEVCKFREEDKESLRSKVKEVLEGGNKNHGTSKIVDQQLASILRGRNEGCSTSATPVPDLEDSVTHWKFDTNEDTFKAQGKSYFVVPYRWSCVEKDFVLKLSLKGQNDAKIKNEAAIMEKCRHPYIVGVVGCWETGLSRSFMMLESMKCTLTERINSMKCNVTEQQNWRQNLFERRKLGFSASEAIDLLFPVAKAMRYMHGKEKPIAHRDIKPDNIMFTKESKDAIKLIDFGESAEFDPDTRYYTTGTTGYMDPQVNFKGKSEHCDLLKADVFSFGMVFAELLTWKTPAEALCAQTNKEFLYPSQVHDFLRLGMRPHVPHVQLSPDGGDTTQLSHQIPIYVAFIVESCWRKSPELRPGFEDLCLMLQNAQYLLKQPSVDAKEALSKVSYTASDGTDWPIPGKFTLREMLDLE